MLARYVVRARGGAGLNVATELQHGRNAVDAAKEVRAPSLRPALVGGFGMQTIAITCITEQPWYANPGLVVRQYYLVVIPLNIYAPMSLFPTSNIVTMVTIMEVLAFVAMQACSYHFGRQGHAAHPMPRLWLWACLWHVHCFAVNVRPPDSCGPLLPRWSTFTLCASPGRAAKCNTTLL